MTNASGCVEVCPPPGAGAEEPVRFVGREAHFDDGDIILLLEHGLQFLHALSVHLVGDAELDLVVAVEELAGEPLRRGIDVAPAVHRQLEEEEPERRGGPRQLAELRGWMEEMDEMLMFMPDDLLRMHAANARDEVSHRRLRMIKPQNPERVPSTSLREMAATG